MARKQEEEGVARVLISLEGGRPTKTRNPLSRLKPRKVPPPPNI
jgi:hypothetical protein